MKIFGWSISAERISDDAPDTVRSTPHFEREVLHQLGEIRAEQAQMKALLTNISAAVCEHDTTLSGHIKAHSEDARRVLRSVPTLSEEA